MFFASDNQGPVPEAVLEALRVANQGYAASYGADAITLDVVSKIQTLFEAPDAAVYLAATGTAANTLALACLCPPWATIYCSPVAHIQEDECNAPEFFTGGAKLNLVGSDDKLTPAALEQAILGTAQGDVHGPQRGPVSLTQITEKGRIYTLSELSELCAVAKAYDLPVHMDGARFANAIVALGCSAAEMTWRCGIDALTFGGTKNGLMGVEAVIFFDPKYAWEFELRRKRGAHLFSKNRFLAAQMQAYLEQDLWRDLAQKANDNSAYLAQGLRKSDAVRFQYEPAANMIFAYMPRAVVQRARQGGAVFSVWSGDIAHGPAEEELVTRLVCDWSLETSQIDQFLGLIAPI